MVINIKFRKILYSALAACMCTPSIGADDIAIKSNNANDIKLVKCDKLKQISVPSKNSAESNEISGEDKLVLGSIAFVALIGGGIFAKSYYDSRRRRKEKEKEIARRKDATKSLTNLIVKEIADDILEEIPVSEKGNLIFDLLLKVTSLDGLKDWGNGKLANISCDSERLQKIDNVLTTKNVICDVLKNQIKITRDQEFNKAKQQDKKFDVGWTFDKDFGIKPIFSYR